jgi:predicted nucleotidyltransferase
MSISWWISCRWGGGQYAEHYFALKAELEVLLRRPVDLVILRGVKNPFFLEGI